MSGLWRPNVSTFRRPPPRLHRTGPKATWRRALGLADAVSGQANAKDPVTPPLATTRTFTFAVGPGGGGRQADQEETLQHEPRRMRCGFRVLPVAATMPLVGPEVAGSRHCPRY